ncbi:MAG: hypothetical protein ABIT83_21105, partial [Massilia sp.]
GTALPQSTKRCVRVQQRGEIMQRFAVTVNPLFYRAALFETAPFQREANYSKPARELQGLTFACPKKTQFL